MDFINNIMNTAGLRELTLQSIALRLLLATVYGGLLGLERSRKRRAAGFRTYILVCAGSALIMMTGQYMLGATGNTDPARLGAQVISGIGFLGAGSIIVTGTRQIRGLTTAAALWASACMGIAIGIGFYVGATLMVLLMLLVMTVFNDLEGKYVASGKTMHVYAVFESIYRINEFMKMVEGQGVVVDDYDTTRSEYGVGVGVFLVLTFKTHTSRKEAIDSFRKFDGLIFVEER